MKKKTTIEVPDGEGWTRTVEIPPPRYSQPITAMNSYDLSKELEQIKIDFECGPGPTRRHTLELRQKDIYKELAWRNGLTLEALERETSIARRASKAPLIRDARVEVSLATSEVRDKLLWFAEQCVVGGSYKSVDELVYVLQQQVETWVEIIEDL